MDDSHPLRKIAVYLYDIRNRNVGLGEYAFQLGSNLASRAVELRQKYGIEFQFIVPSGFKGCMGNDVKYIEYSLRKRAMVRHFTEVDICHITHQLTRLKYMRRAKNNLLTVHDINFMYEKSGDRLEWYKIRFAKALTRCNAITYISEFVKRDVESHFSPRYDGSVIYNGVTDLTSTHGDFAKFNLNDGEYLFHISSLMPKKNVHKIVEMMRYMPEEKLVVVGNLDSNYAKRIAQNIKDWGLTNVVMLEHVSNEDKAELYRHCKAFIFPSLCEGFGLPPVEAMHFGKPVFLSTLTSLPEIGGDYAFYYDNLDPEVMAAVTREGLDEYYAQPELFSEALQSRARSFNWRKCADEYIDLYLKILKTNTNSLDN